MAGGLPHPVLLSTFCNMDQITIGGQVVEFKHVFYSWVCMAVLFVVAYLVRRRLTLVPGGMQNFFEALIDTIENFICNTMGEAGRRFVPLLRQLLPDGGVRFAPSTLNKPEEVDALIHDVRKLAK